MMIMDAIADDMPLFRLHTPVHPETPRQMIVAKCNVHRAVELNRVWHSRFPEIHWSNVVRNKDYVCFVAEYDAIAYATAIWSSPIAANRLADGNIMLELRRMAICLNAPKNTASWMLAKMTKFIARTMPHIKTLISYQDTEFHAGTIYKASGWSVAATSEWVAWGKTRKRNQAQSQSRKARWEKYL